MNFRSLLILSLVLLPLEATAASETEESDVLPIFAYPWLFRAHGSLGVSSGATEDGGSSLGFTSGVQLMLPANEYQSYGFGVDFVQTDDREETRYIATGLFIEQRPLDTFLMSIGAVGYIPLEDPSPTPFGLSTKLGYAPNLGSISPFVAFRSDWIFRDRTENMISLDVGITVALE